MLALALVSVHQDNVEHRNPHMLYKQPGHQWGTGSHMPCRSPPGNPKVTAMAKVSVLVLETVLVHLGSVAHRSPHMLCTPLDHQWDIG